MFSLYIKVGWPWAKTLKTNLDRMEVVCCFGLSSLDIGGIYYSGHVCAHPRGAGVSTAMTPSPALLLEAQQHLLPSLQAFH